MIAELYIERLPRNTKQKKDPTQNPNTQRGQQQTMNQQRHKMDRAYKTLFTLELYHNDKVHLTINLLISASQLHMTLAVSGTSNANTHTQTLMSFY